MKYFFEYEPLLDAYQKLLKIHCLCNTSFSPRQKETIGKFISRANLLYFCLLVKVKDYYRILELLPNASLNDIKKAYKKLALKYHPDSHSGLKDANTFIEVTEAYEVLSDPIKRREYDELYFNNVHTSISILSKQKNWEDFGREKATQYSALNLKEFSKRLEVELKLNVQYFPRIYFIGFLIVISVYMLASVPTLFKKDTAIGIISILLILVMGFWAYNLSIAGIKKYKAERKKLFK